MKLKGRIFQKSIFSRLIFTFLVILLPIYLLSVGIHEWGVAIIRTEIMNSMKSQMDYHKIILQNELSRIQSLQYDCMSDDDLLKLANIPNSLSDFDRAQSMNRLQSRLYTLQNSSIYIEEVKVIFPLLERSISSINEVIPISEKDMDIVHSFSDNNISKLVNENNELFSRVRNISLNNSKTYPRFVLQIKFSNTTLKNTFLSFDTYNRSGSMLYYPNQRYVLTTVNDSTITNQIEKFITKNKEKEDSFKDSVISGKTKYLTFGQKLNFNNIWLAAYIPEAQVFAPLKKYIYLLWFFTIISISIIALFSYSTHKFLQRPLKKLVSAFKKVEAGEMKFNIQHNTNDEFQYLYTRFNAMLEYVNNLIDQVFTQKIMSQKAELKQLQSQINPHFLYNSFFIMQRMIQGDDKENAIKFCNFLGQYFKYVTRNAQDEIPLYKEVEHARNYMEIQAIRFSKTSIEFGELPIKYRDFLVPRLILQPIIENAFEHGFNKNGNQRIISVRFNESVDGLHCIVEDNGGGVEDLDLYKLNQRLSEEDASEESTGLININKRIKLKFGGSCGVAVSRGEMGGWKVEIFFQAKEENNV